MFCPFCRHPDSRVVDSRTSDEIKRSGVVEPFSREKIMAGVRKACQGRPVTDSDLAMLAQKVEESVRATGVSQIDANEIGVAVLAPLRELDEVAYLRFASVYQAFDSLDDFEDAIGALREEHHRPTAAAE
jgi:transcriptional repressor NrdR